MAANFNDSIQALLYKACVSLQAISTTANVTPYFNDTVQALTYKMDLLIAGVGGGGSITPEAFAALDLSSLPTSDPGSGKPWLNGGVVQVGP